MLIIVGGAAGSGKSTVGKQLAEALACPFIDADNLHSPENVAKMTAGHPLTDADRWGWLAKVARLGSGTAVERGTAVVACSALSRAYRERLRENSAAPILFVMLCLTRPELERRLENRVGHFMKANMLDSQLATLEVPEPSEHCVVVDETATFEDIMAATKAKLV